MGTDKYQGAVDILSEAVKEGLTSWKYLRRSLKGVRNLSMEIFEKGHFKKKTKKLQIKFLRKGCI